MRSIRSTQAFVLLIALGACEPAPFTRSAHHTFPARAKGCSVTLTDTAPHQGYEVIGTFEITNQNKWGAERPVDTEDKLRALIGDRACEAGADQLITTKRADLYVKAVAIRFNPDVEPVEHTSAVPTPD